MGSEQGLGFGSCVLVGEIRGRLAARAEASVPFGSWRTRCVLTFRLDAARDTHAKYYHKAKQHNTTQKRQNTKQNRTEPNKAK
eukprot:54906-Rhodomonas_salina.1